MTTSLSRIVFAFAALAALFGSSLHAAKATPLPDDPAVTDQDRIYMKRAYELAVSATTKGNTCYGALLVKDGKVLMEGENDAITSGDTTHHAETGLISKATVALGRDVVSGAVLYTSTEPCIMCCGAIRFAGIKKFVYGTTAIQVTRLRGTKLPDQPLQCREVFQRMGFGDVVIVGPVDEARGLVDHAAALAKGIR
ncbi:MAG TPA: nucleoside deaminase [Opitutaceae bacterium]|nr:nucleoside deaminase [Opitutaceae bacterium]